MAECYEVLGKYEYAIRYYMEAANACRQETLGIVADFQIEAMRKYFMKKVCDLSCYNEGYRRVYWENTERVLHNWGYRRLCVFVYKKKLLFAGKAEKAEWLKRLGLLYLWETAEYKKAARCFEKAASEATGPGEMSEYECDIAAAYYMMGQYEDAKRHGEAAFLHFYHSGQGTVEDYLEYKPLQAKRLGYVGWMLLCVGRTDEAVGYFEKMDKVGCCKSCTCRECYKGRMFMGCFYESLGQIGQAKAKFREALLWNPHSMECYWALQRCEKNMVEI